MFWLGPPAPNVLPKVPGSDSKTHLESRCCAVLIYNVILTGLLALEAVIFATFLPEASGK